MSAPVRVAVAGLGWAARSIWLPRLAALPGYVVTALVDPDPAASAAAAGQAPGARLHTSPDELDPAAVDLAVVAVPNHAHAAVASGLLRRGIAVFVEKPVCLDEAEAAELADAERLGGAVLLAGSAARYRADVRALVDAAATVGELRHVDLSWVRARGVPDAGGWFTDRRTAGGGALLDLGWHLLDAATPVVGRLDVEHVAATVSGDFVNDPTRRAGWRPDAVARERAPGDVEDTVRAFLVTESGVSVALRASWASHEARDTTVLTVEGTEGVARLRATFGFSPHRVGGSTLTTTRAGVTDELDPVDEPVGREYDRQLEELPALLRDPRSRGVAIAEARRAVALIDRIYTSARTVEPTAARTGSRS
ncbi:Gfo/Idh/MocA family protein [Pseudonocardia oroxyli]|uniref:Oxidoreductase n=1 Tax=Pseudonocardia oroxyli TaxID=366584 RepID=A0A1G8C9C6_PSEOR|nr:Gfo/Idh/MocA family oxidoreductase [Pseudonocardia oroxyli]SDH42127.1 oxidoreductase [Pseudonocardia oroxyli]